MHSQSSHRTETGTSVLLQPAAVREVVSPKEGDGRALAAGDGSLFVVLGLSVGTVIMISWPALAAECKSAHPCPRLNMERQLAPRREAQIQRSGAGLYRVAV